MASTKLQLFVEGVAKGLSGFRAALAAGYSPATAKNPKKIWGQREARELYRAAQRRHGRHVLSEPPARSLKERTTYFVRDESGRCKIGATCNVDARVNQLRVGSPEKLTLVLTVEGDHEAEYHAKFSALNIKGDWFFFRDALEQFVAEQQQIEQPSEVEQ